MKLVHRAGFAALFLSLAWGTIPRLSEVTGEAAALAPLGREARRAKIFGPFYESVRRIDAAVPDEEPLAVISSGPGPQLFLNYDLYPQRTKFFPTFLHYRAERDRPKRMVRIDGEARLLTYEEGRAAEIGSSTIAASGDLKGEVARQSFVVPLASSGDGRPPDVWTTEAVMQNEGSERARVTIRMQPSQRSATIELRPGEVRRWNDLVYQLYGVLDAGWLQIESDHPVRAGFWFVNRPLRDAARIPTPRFARFFAIPDRHGSRIWLLNPYDRRLPVRLNGGTHVLVPRSLIPIEWPDELGVESGEELYVFQSWRDARGATHFYWPEAR